VREIRWHARAGQGAKTASQLYANAALRAGKWVQAFPEYGPERRGAPLRAFTRVDDRPIRRHDAVTTPDVVVVLEPAVSSS
jgi:pyruvate ferredoxin oxidoreductase gamma subunit